MTTFTRFYGFFLFPAFYYDSVFDLSNPPSIWNNCAPHMAIKTTTTISSFRSLGYCLREPVRKSFPLTFMFFGQWLARVLYLRKQKISFHLLRRTWLRVNLYRFVFPMCKTTYIKNSAKNEEFVCETKFVAYLVIFLYPSFDINIIVSI